MKYISPTINNKPYWVPIVVKNRDYLIGYLKGVLLLEDILSDSLKMLGLKLNLDIIDLFLDSSRFNDIIEDDRRESEMSTDEKKKFLINLINEKIHKLNNPHVENQIHYGDILNVDCKCGLGFYSWKKEKDIPKKDFKCSVCGRLLIQYTGHDDFEYIFDEGKKENNDGIDKKS